MVKLVDENDLLVARRLDTVDNDGNHYKRVSFAGLTGSWRSRIPDGPAPVVIGELLAYLEGAPPNDYDLANDQPDMTGPASRLPTRVIDRTDAKQLVLSLQ